MLLGIIILVLIGILCGWLAGKIFRGGGFGCSLTSSLVLVVVS